MPKFAIAMAVAGLASLGPAGAASAFERNFSIETDRGTLEGSTEVFCFDGACYRDSELRAEDGATLRRSGMCVRVAWETWHCKGTLSGPHGNSITRRATIRFD